MDLGLRGKTAIVTGGAKGIGSGCSEVLAQEGCNVVVVSRSDETLVKAFADGLSEKYGVKTLAVLADVSKPQQIDGVFDKAIAAFGQVDILINNAGGGAALKPFEELTDEEWAMAMDKPQQCL
ncbi:MAG: SDR family NAD(P)-dependent oxidoreductase [Christensenellales bacterium]